MEKEMATSSGVLAQHKLGKTRPNDWTTVVEKGLTLTWKIDDEGRVIYQYRTVAITPTSILDLKIDENSWVVISLDSDKRWQWSRTLDAVTTKDPRDQHYFELGYRTEAGQWVAREDFPADEPIRQIRFGAKLNRGNAEKHGFSFNIDLEYPDGILPITIDPDIRNPGNQ